MPKLFDATPISFRTRQKDRDLIQRAAQVEQEYPGDFARKAALARARRVLKDAEARQSDSVSTVSEL
jgi:uncharacterized protein (DUF1778 family)